MVITTLALISLTAVAADPQAPTPLAEVERVLAHVQPTEDDVLYDLGCGDGRICVLASLRYGCRSVGVEIDSRKVALARKTVTLNGVEDLVTIRLEDVRRTDLVQATIVYVYLPEKLLAELVPQFVGSDLLVISYIHQLPGQQGKQFRDFYLYQF